MTPRAQSRTTPCSRQQAGQRHDDAANLIQSIQPGGAHLASKFRQLVAYKDDAQYAPKTMGASSAKAAVRQAADLVGAAKSHP